MMQMQEYTREMQRTVLQMIAGGLFICGSAYVTGYGRHIPGFIMGMSGSVLYCLLLWYRVLKSTDMSVQKAIFYMRVGWIIRLFFIASILFLSLKIPVFDFGSAVVGLFTLQIVMVCKAVVFVTAKSFRSR